MSGARLLFDAVVGTEDSVFGVEVVGAFFFPARETRNRILLLEEVALASDLGWGV